MALSFLDSIEKIKASLSETGENSIDNDSDTASLAVSTLADDSSEWTNSDKYAWYEEYTDEHISTIDAKKNVSVNDYQINLTQESYSQFIPFVMDRYYDGVDMMTKTFWIHYITPEDTEDMVQPVNVRYTDDQIELGWLVSPTATNYAGTLTFEIIAVGSTSKDESYIWKTKPCTSISVLKSMVGSGIIETTSNMYEYLEELKSKIDVNGESIDEINQKLAEITSIPIEYVRAILNQ